MSGGKRIADAASKLEGEALAEVDDMTKDLDDGDDASNDDETDDEDDNSDESQGSLLQKDKNAKHNSTVLSKVTSKAMATSNATATSVAVSANDPCGVTVERIAIDKNEPCDVMPPSCCSCNKYWTTAQGHGNDEMGWCSYVPEDRVCRSGQYLEKHPNTYPQQVCGAPDRKSVV